MQNQTLEIEIFPNPVHNILNITIKDNLPTEIVIYDITSRILFKQSFSNSTTLNIQKIAEGIYFYQLNRNKKVIKKGKIIKE